MKYNTKQQECITQYFIDNKDKHITASEICSFFKSAGSPVSTATVYRCLDRLCNQGIIKKYVIDNDAPACYQYVGSHENCHEHLHLKCTKCGTLFHIDCAQASGIHSHVLEHHDFEIDNSKTVFYGLCSKCRKGEN